MNKQQPKTKKFRLRHLVLIVLTVFIFIVFKEKLLKILLIPFLFFLGCISTFYKRFTRISLGIELITFTTMFYALSIGPIFAMIASILMVFIAAVISNRLCIPTLIQIACYISTIIITIPLRGISPIAYGIIFVFIFNVLLHSIYVFAMNFELTNSITSFILNVALNLYLITTVLTNIL